jgi:outer membrane protein assembly factor BamB
MKISELVFVGIGKWVVALNRATGEQVWKSTLKSDYFINVVLDGGKLFATSAGEISCLDPFTGEVLWHNPLKGFGTGLATIATEAGAGYGPTAVNAEKQHQNQAVASTVVITAAR